MIGSRTAFGFRLARRGLSADECEDAWSIDAEATRQATRGATRNYDALWREKASAAGRLRTNPASVKGGQASRVTRMRAVEAWSEIANALRVSTVATDQRLAEAAIDMVWSDTGRRSQPPRVVEKMQTPERRGPSQESPDRSR